MAREALVLDGRFMAFARSKAGERLWLTYYQRNYGNRVDPSLALVYQNQLGHVSSMGHIDFDTISEEVVAKRGRLGLTAITLTQTMSPIWLSKGFKLLSKDEVQALTPGNKRKGSLTPKKERKASRAKEDPDLKRRRNINKTPDLQANSKRSRRNTISTPITPEVKAAAKRAFQDTTKPMDEQSNHNFQVTEAEAHESGQMPTFARMPRQWALDTNTVHPVHEDIEDFVRALSFREILEYRALGEA
ncbi:hypothetical protein J4E86_011635 [Alternaria arbusti]|uniref:uncharacterized protein n=1 Tax=Alternaria arbusti TaxID=232088 RepID=UPI00221F27BF|nr:uncharacterized protein J4E86_011635 [Alternaria arbusti]KAI4931068.1 hypothetical protein J4E86_011635 [Alternaria arbusti]